MNELKFRLATVSSEDQRHPAAHLLSHHSGWQTARNCPYPQQITLQFPCMVKTKSLELTSHQYKISSKMEVFIKKDGEALYRRLGHFALSSNKSSGFKRREIKTVFFEFPCQFIKIVMARNYPNDYNIFNQVGIISLKVFGHCPELQAISAQVQPKANAVSQLAQLEHQMREAAKNQNFQQAAHLQRLIHHFKQYQNRLKDLQRMKKEAKEAEDYERCAELKDQIASLKRQAISGADPTQNLSHHSNKTSEDIGYYVNHSILKHSQLIQQSLEYHQDYPHTNISSFQPPPQPPSQAPTQTPSQKPSQTPPKNTSPTKVPTDYDSLIIPTLRGQKNKPQQQKQRKDEEPVLQPLQSKNLALVESHVQVLPVEFWTHLFSQVWKFREKGLRDLKELLSSNKVKLAEPGLFNALLEAVYRTISDRNINVVQASVELLQIAAIDLELPALNRPQLHSETEFILETLIDKLADTNTKLRDCCLRVVIRLPQHPAFGHTACLHSILSPKRRAQKNTKLLVAKAKLLIELLKDDERAADQHFDAAIKYAQCHVEHQSIDVRQVINELIYVLASQQGVDKVAPFFDKTRQGIKSVLSERLKDLDIPPKEKQRNRSKHQKRGQKHIQKHSQKHMQKHSQRQRENEHPSKSRNGRSPVPQQQSESQSYVWPPPLSSVREQQAIPSAAPQKENYFKRLDFMRLQKDRLQRSKEYQSNFFKDIECQDISKQMYEDQLYDDSSLQESIDRTRRQFRKVQASQQHSMVESDLEEECEYCGAVNPRFREQDFYNQHLMEECMLVVRCESCRSMVEVWELSSHLLNQCKHKGSYQGCRVCGLAVLADSMPTHKIIGCQPRKRDGDRCQLCQRDIIPGEKESWRRHVLSGLCSGHDRAR